MFLVDGAILPKSFAAKSKRLDEFYYHLVSGTECHQNHRNLHRNASDYLSLTPDYRALIAVWKLIYYAMFRNLYDNCHENQSKLVCEMVENTRKT